MTSMAAWMQPRDGSPVAEECWGQHGVGLRFVVDEQGCLLIARMESGGPASRSGVCMVGNELLKVLVASAEQAKSSQSPAN